MVWATFIIGVIVVLHTGRWQAICGTILMLTALLISHGWN
jgi:hypothetical protein